MDIQYITSLKIIDWNIAILITFVACVYIFYDSLNLGNFLGDFFGLVTALGLACNATLARYAKDRDLVPSAVVADIEKGGVFAQIIGTIALMKPDEKKLIKGIIINRFRGDKALFESGVTWIEKETGIPVLGEMRYVM